MVGIATAQNLFIREFEELGSVPFLTAGNPPTWALRVLRRVSHAELRDDIPTLVWYRHRKLPHPFSSGVTQRFGKLKRLVITVREGERAQDKLHVLYHEIAHWLVSVGEGHTPAYYERLFELIDYHAPDLFDYAVSREGRYKALASRQGLARFLVKRREASYKRKESIAR